MNDMSAVIEPRSDQWNADDLISGPRTIRIAGVKISAGTEQPVSILIEGEEKVFRPCKSMSRVLVAVWGPDAKAYVGRSVTLYRDPKVKWGGMEVGGIRISHMSDLEAPKTLALTETRASRKPFTVKPLQVQAATQAETPDKSTTAATDLIARINAATDITILDAITEHATTRKQMTWFADKRTELHTRISDAINLRTAALQAEPEGREDADMGEAHTDDADPFDNA